MARLRHSSRTRLAASQQARNPQPEPIARNPYQTDERVRALVIDFGFVPTRFNPAGRLPPTLVLHGAADRVVPVSNAQALRTVLERRGIPHEVQIYLGQGHGLTGEAQADAARRMRAFLDRSLHQKTFGT